MNFDLVGQYDGYCHEIDLAYIYESAVNYGWPYYGIEIKNDLDNNNNIYGFYSENAPNRSYSVGVYWEWGVEPSAPTQLHPTGARSLVKPHFIASTAKVEVGTFQIQVSMTTSFTSPIRDNTVIAVDADGHPQMINYYPGAEFAALSSNSQYYWRCRFTTVDGVTSRWSAVTEFGIFSKPTVNITSIVAGLTTDESPELTWDYTPGEGGIQSKYVVTLFLYNQEKDNYQDPYYDSNLKKWIGGYKIAGEGVGTSITVPAGILQTRRSYRQRVKVWDSVARDADISEDDFAQDYTYWRARPDLGTAPASQLAVALQPTPTALAWHGAAPMVRLTWARAEIPDKFKVYRKILNDPDATWQVLAEDTPDQFAPDYSSGTYAFIDFAPGGQDILYTVHAVVAGKVSHATSVNADMGEQPLSDDWDLSLSGTAAAYLDRKYEAGTYALHFCRITITNGGSGINNIWFGQELPPATAGTVYLTQLRARSKEGNRTIQMELRKTATPGTVYGTLTCALTSEWQWFTLSSTVTDSVSISMRLYCGGDTDDVDVDYFATRIPGATVELASLTTNGFWLVAEENQDLMIPLTRVVENADIEYSELGEESYHPYGGFFHVVRTPHAAKKMTISGWVTRESGVLLTLERILEDNLICLLSSSKGLSARVVLGKNVKISEVKELHGRQMYNLQLTALEIGYER